MNENVLKASDGYGRATGEFMDDRSYRGLFGDLPELKTERLTLRKMEMSDANDMYSYASLDEVTRYLLWTPHLNIDETKGYIEYVRREYRKGSVADWAISLDSESRMIGTVGFSAVDRENNSVEIGYVLNPLYWGKGYAREALRRAVEAAFCELGAHRVQLRIMDGNVRSENVALACGFRKEGSLRDLLLVNGAYRTIHIYSLVSDEYFSLLK